MSAQQRMQVEQQNVVNLLYDTIQRVINTYRTDKGYAIIISTEAAAAYDSKSDVTNEVLELVNKQKLEFKPAAPEPPPPPRPLPPTRRKPPRTTRLPRPRSKTE